ncbi:hypothetical protein [Nonlabens sp.]|uniref:hypothetical protein n=1 Tax=Nonlabens sp. TaxID=1888209 RepID=UPI00326475D3
MRKISFLLFVTVTIISCSSDSIEEERFEVQKKRPSAISKRMIITNCSNDYNYFNALKKNSYIISEMMRDNPVFRSSVLSNLNQSNRVVRLSDIIDLSSDNLLSSTYRFYYTNSLFSDLVTFPDGSSKWPPKVQPPISSNPSTNSSGNQGISDGVSVQSHINLLLSKDVELYIPNKYTGGDFYSVGHPLNENQYSQGHVIFKTAIENFNRYTNQINYFYSYPMNINNVMTYQEKFVVLSRPSNCTFENFELTDYMKKHVSSDDGTLFE